MLGGRQGLHKYFAPRGNSQKKPEENEKKNTAASQKKKSASPVKEERQANSRKRRRDFSPSPTTSPTRKKKRTSKSPPKASPAKGASPAKPKKSQSPKKSPPKASSPPKRTTRTGANSKKKSKASHPDLEFTPNEQKKKEVIQLDYDANEIMKDAEEKPSPSKKAVPSTISVGKGFSWQSRDGPPNKGNKEIPEGNEFCLYGFVFIITGVLDSLEREEAAALIQQYGGKVVKSITAKSLTHVLSGTEAGPKKMEVAAERKLPVLDEDALFQLIQTEPTKKLSAKEKEKIRKMAIPKHQQVKAAKVTKTTAVPSGMAPATKLTDSGKQVQAKPSSSNALWTTLYHPSRIADLVGNPTNIKKLKDWLSSWKPDTKKERAALLSGPPGVGKTSSATIIAKELGFEPIEFNASDTRSKKAMEQHISELLGNRTISSMFGTSARDLANRKKGKTVLIMDEVDGMSGSDRGGVAKLIQLIKTTKIPVICICNDRQSTKIRSLRNYCLELNFREVTANQVSPRLLGIAQSEHLQLDGETVYKIATMANGDIRQMLNMMQMHSVTRKHMSTKDVSSMTTKEGSVGLFEVIPQLMSKDSYAKLSLSDKMQLYFSDPALVPLFVQDNYISCRPYNASTPPTQQQRSITHMNLLASAAESISDSDMLDVSIRQQQNWGLMPTHAVVSSIRPSFFVQGSLSGRQNFPAWLGKNSTTRKNYRLLEDIRDHMQASVFASRKEVCLQYAPVLRRPLSQPLLQGDPAKGIAQVIEYLDQYHLTREDWTSLFDLTQFSTIPDPISSIPTSTKSKFTREYNKTHKAAAPTRSGSSGAAEPPALTLEGEEPAEQSEEEETDQTDALIKEKKPRKAPAKKPATKKTTTRKKTTKK